MDFIERILHVSPDARNGMLEVVYAATAALVAFVVANRKRFARGARERNARDAGRPGA